VNETKITTIKQITAYDAEMRPVEAYELTFTVGPHGPFKITCPAKDYTAVQGKAAVEKRAVEIRNTVGF